MRVDHEIVVIGAGFSGLGMAARLLDAGLDDFVVFEKEPEVGGTWWANTYPGCACDVPSHLYSFSFAPNPHWPRMFSRQPEILAYLRGVSERFKLRPKIRFNTSVTSCRFDEKKAYWVLRVRRLAEQQQDSVRLVGGTNGGSVQGEADEQTITARVLIAGFGALSRPCVPAIPGLEDFSGEMFHSQAWNHDYSLRGKSVAVVGTGASAIQFVPHVVEEAGRVAVFQRTPPWILSKPDRDIGASERRLFSRFPWLQRLYRYFLYWTLEARVLPLTRFRSVLRIFEALARKHLRDQVDDPDLRERLVPHYALGCKRILVSDDYYPALEQEHVELVTDSVERIEGDRIVTADGRERSFDALILGTGFLPTDPLPRGLVFGRSGRDLVDSWEDGPEAYLGSMVAGFPNLFLLNGPNTGLGHTSVILMIESQIEHVMSALKQLQSKDLDWVEVSEGQQERFNRELRRKMERTVWVRGGCSSWYKTGAGKNTSLWPGSTWSYRLRTRRFDLGSYVFGRAENDTAFEESET